MNLFKKYNLKFFLEIEIQKMREAEDARRKEEQARIDLEVQEREKRIE